jgi:hypothetical protein
MGEGGGAAAAAAGGGGGLSLSSYAPTLSDAAEKFLHSGYCNPDAALPDWYRRMKDFTDTLSGASQQGMGGMNEMMQFMFMKNMMGA